MAFQHAGFSEIGALAQQRAGARQRGRRAGAGQARERPVIWRHVRRHHAGGQVASTLKANPQITKLRVEGHTDKFAGPRINVPLSRARAQAVRDYLMENPEVLIEAMNALEQRRLAEETKNDAAMIAQLSDQIYNDGHSWIGGNPEGDVTVVEFIDYRCGVCKQVFPHVEDTVAKDENLKIVFKEFPILGQESELAARFAIAVKQAEGDEAYKKVHDNFYTMRGNVTVDSLKAISEEMGFQTDAIIEAMQGDAVTDVLRENAQLAQALQVSGTPTFIIGDTLLRGMPQTGIVPVIDLARIYALGAGNPAVNTHDRLAHAAESGEISPEGARDLREALEFLAGLRIRHQAERMQAGFEADNQLRPSDLSNFERSQLKDAFGVVKTLQDVLAMRYRGG